MYATTETVAMAWSTPVRNPPYMTGSALGNSARKSTWSSVMPMARAASTTFRSTLEMPA